jgi:hypothetical protein
VEVSFQPRVKARQIVYRGLKCVEILIFRTSYKSVPRSQFLICENGTFDFVVK